MRMIGIRKNERDEDFLERKAVINWRLKFRGSLTFPWESYGLVFSLTTRKNIKCG